MSTKNFVPRADNEGGIGTSAKRWAEGNFVTLKKNGEDVATFNDAVNASPKFYSVDNKFADYATNWKIGDIVRQNGKALKMTISFNDVPVTVNSVFTFSCSDVPEIPGGGGSVNLLFNLVSGVFINSLFEFAQFTSADILARDLGALLESLSMPTGFCYVNGSEVTFYTGIACSGWTEINSPYISMSCSQYGLIGNYTAGANVYLFGTNSYSNPIMAEFNVTFPAGLSGNDCASILCNTVNGSNQCNISATIESNVVTLIGLIGDIFSNYAISPNNYINTNSSSHPDWSNTDNLGSVTFDGGDLSVTPGTFIVKDSTSLNSPEGYIQITTT